MKAYPHPCSHCGLCCMSVVCPIGAALMRLPTTAGPCPALEWDEVEKDKSRCGLLANPKEYGITAPPDLLAVALGSGAGCCVKARVVVPKTGEEKDFAPLSAELKVEVARAVRSKKMPLIYNPKA